MKRRATAVERKSQDEGDRKLRGEKERENATWRQTMRQKPNG